MCRSGQGHVHEIEGARGNNAYDQFQVTECPDQYSGNGINEDDGFFVDCIESDPIKQDQACAKLQLYSHLVNFKLRSIYYPVKCTKCLVIMVHYKNQPRICRPTMVTPYRHMACVLSPAYTRMLH